MKLRDLGSNEAHAGCPKALSLFSLMVRPRLTGVSTEGRGPFSFTCPFSEPTGLTFSTQLHG